MGDNPCAQVIGQFQCNNDNGRCSKWYVTPNRGGIRICVQTCRQLKKPLLYTTAAWTCRSSTSCATSSTAPRACGMLWPTLNTKTLGLYTMAPAPANRTWVGGCTACLLQQLQQYCHPLCTYRYSPSPVPGKAIVYNGVHDLIDATLKGMNCAVDGACVVSVRAVCDKLCTVHPQVLHQHHQPSKTICIMQILVSLGRAQAKTSCLTTA